MMCLMNTQGFLFTDSHSSKVPLISMTTCQCPHVPSNWQVKAVRKRCENPLSVLSLVLYDKAVLCQSCPSFTFNALTALLHHAVACT